MAFAAWERALGKPVITTNQANIAGRSRRYETVNNPMPGLGRLLEQMPR
jgi:maleate cis-trans isomerase